MLSMTSRETRNATALPLRVMPRTPNCSVSRTAFGTEAANSVMVKSAFFIEKILISDRGAVNRRPAYQVLAKERDSNRGIREIRGKTEHFRVFHVFGGALAR